MGTKNNPGSYDCYRNAEPDEPVFVLLGRDPNAPTAVRKWAEQRKRMIDIGLKPESDLPMVREAMECAITMDQYRTQREQAKAEAAQTASELTDAAYGTPPLTGGSDGAI
jgi:hypothetical protein